MKIKELTVSKGLKVSAHYNTVQSNISLTAELNENDNIDEAYEQLSNLAEQMLSRDLENQANLLAEKKYMLNHY